MCRTDHRLSAGAAQRSELAAGRTRPSVKGTVALTEFEVEAAPAARSDEKSQSVKICPATADVNPPETPLAAIFDDRSEQAPRHWAGRDRHRRQ